MNSDLPSTQQECKCANRRTETFGRHQNCKRCFIYRTTVVPVTGVEQNTPNLQPLHHSLLICRFHFHTDIMSERRSRFRYRAGPLCHFVPAPLFIIGQNQSNVHFQNTAISTHPLLCSQTHLVPNTLTTFSQLMTARSACMLQEPEK